MMTRAAPHESLPAGTCTSTGVTTTGEVVLESRLTCPVCGHLEVVTMPTDACMWLYECKGCNALMRPLAGDCCVFCSYGSVPCPSVQEQWAYGRRMLSVGSIDRSADGRGPSEREAPDGFPTAVATDFDAEESAGRPRGLPQEPSTPLWLRIGLGAALAALVLYAVVHTVKH